MNELLKKLKDINDDDLKTMFGTTVISLIEKKPDVEEKLKEYLDFEFPAYFGDIIEYNGERYVVTCVYTDNSVDICGKDADKKNIGLYMKDIKVVVKLQVIREDY